MILSADSNQPTSITIGPVHVAEQPVVAPVKMHRRFIVSGIGLERRRFYTFEAAKRYLTESECVGQVMGYCWPDGQTSRGRPLPV